MFIKIPNTKYPPHHALFVYDGECGFCEYWIKVWSRKTVDLTYKTYQEIASDFPDIPLKEFKKASRLIETGGSVFAGPDSAYRTFYYFTKPQKYWHHWYKEHKLFRSLSDHGYNFIAKNRPLMMKLTVALWGGNPLKRKPYWFLWLIGIFAIILGAVLILG